MKNRGTALFVTIDGGGNLPPVLGIARDLSENGYRISVLSEPCMENMIRTLGYHFIPFKRHFTRQDRKEDIFNDWNVSPLKNPVLENIVFGPTRIVTEETMDAINQTDARLLELAQMLGQVGEATLQSANEIFQTAQELKRNNKR